MTADLSAITGGPPPRGAAAYGYPVRMAAGFVQPTEFEVETMRGRAEAVADGEIVILWGRPFLALRKPS